MIPAMSFLIDGNNLMYAVGSVGPDVDREGLCELLWHLADRGERVRVVFDGAPRDGLGRESFPADVEVVFAFPRIADDVICDLIAADSAPRRLTVVSTDREIRQAARRRRCMDCRSEEFVPFLLHLRDTPAKGPAEPREKRHGLSPEQTQAWLEEFRLTDGEGNPLDPTL